MTTQSVTTKYKNHLLFAFFLFAAVIIGVVIASERLDTFEVTARVQAAEQQAVLTTIAETMARNGADSVTESIVRDCAIDDRARFDQLLGQLDRGLSGVELRELDSLFGACASFFSERKALMVARFNRETEVYVAQVELLDTLTASDEVESARVARWQELVQEERVQSDLFAELVTAQKEIIDALIEGKSAQSDEIVVILTNVNEIREALAFSRQKAADIRSELTTL